MPMHCIFWCHVSTANDRITFFNSKICIERFSKVWSLFGTHYVPAIRLVFPSVSSISKSFAKPKSEILGFMSPSNKMFPAFRSRWIILRRESSWRYRSPPLMPSMILYRLAQSSCWHLPGSIPWNYDPININVSTLRE